MENLKITIKSPNGGETSFDKDEYWEFRAKMENAGFQSESDFIKYKRVLNEMDTKIGIMQSSITFLLKQIKDSDDEFLKKIIDDMLEEFDDLSETVSVEKRLIEYGLNDPFREEDEFFEKGKE